MAYSIRTPLSEQRQADICIRIAFILRMIIVEILSATVMINVLSIARNPPASRPKWHCGISNRIAHICRNKADFVKVVPWQSCSYLIFIQKINRRDKGLVMIPDLVSPVSEVSNQLRGRGEPFPWPEIWGYIPISEIASDPIFIVYVYTRSHVHVYF